jgi:hypothetical protein
VIGDHAPSAELKAVRAAHAVLVNTCPFCGQVHESPVFTLKKWDAWLEARKRGAHVQSFWPELSPAEREEFFVSGVCDACWKRTFTETEEEDEG